MAFERQQSAVASLTLSCPGLSAPGLTDAAGQYQLVAGLRLACEPIRNRTCHRGTEPQPDTTHIQQRPSHWASERGHWGPRSASRLTSDLPPCLDTSTHNARPVAADQNMEGMKEGKRASDCCMRLFVYVCARMYVVGMATWSVTVGPPDFLSACLSPPPDVQLLSQVSLLKARREELHQG